MSPDLSQSSEHKLTQDNLNNYKLFKTSELIDLPSLFLDTPLNYSAMIFFESEQQTLIAPNYEKMIKEFEADMNQRL
jgi:hypothetical protein